MSSYREAYRAMVKSLSRLTDPEAVSDAAAVLAVVEDAKRARAEAKAMVLRDVPPELAAMAGEEFTSRAREAAANILPMTAEALAAFAEGPEVSGGVDVEPDDVSLENE